MIKWTNKEKLFLCITLISIILVPIVIHIMYKIDFGIELLYSTWSSGEILQYCGSILTAILAIIGVYYTIKVNRQNDLENKIIESRPYLRTNFIQLLSFEELESINDNLNRVCLWNESGSMSFNLNNNQTKMHFINSYGSYKFLDENMIICYEIENIGLGNAMNFSLSINENIFFPELIICKNEKIRIYILLHKKIIGTTGIKISIVLNYDDVININKYEQKESLFINYNKKDKTYTYYREFDDELSEPYIIEKKILK